MRSAMMWAVGLVAVLAGQAQAELRFTPHVEAGVDQTGEALTVPVDRDESLTARRDLYAARWAAGLEYGPLEGATFGGGTVHLRSAVAADVLLGPGRWALTVEQDLRWRRPLGPLWLAVGPGLAGRLDLERPAFSALELGLPVGLGWGPVELSWRPAWRVPLGEEASGPFDLRRHGASAGIDWLALSLRVHVAALAW